MEVWSIDSKKTNIQWSIIDQYDRLLGHNNNWTRTPKLELPENLTVSGRNPIEWIEQIGPQYLPLVTHRGSVHGNFHADNIFTEGEHLWAVDFERTGNGPVFADFAVLTVDAITRLVPDSIGHDEYHRVFRSLFVGSDQLGLPTDASGGDELIKAVRFIGALRNLAHSWVGELYWGEYLWSLLLASLAVPDQSSFLPVAHAAQRAWILAAILCDAIEHNIIGLNLDEVIWADFSSFSGGKEVTKFLTGVWRIIVKTDDR